MGGCGGVGVFCKFKDQFKPNKSYSQGRGLGVGFGCFLLSLSIGLSRSMRGDPLVAFGTYRAKPLALLCFGIGLGCAILRSCFFRT